MGKCCLHASSFIFDGIIIKFAGNQDRHKSLNEFNFRLDQTTQLGVSCPWMTKIYTFELEYLWGQLANRDQILCAASLGVGKGCIVFWGRLDTYKNLDKFDFEPLVSMAHLYVFWNERMSSSACGWSKDLSLAHLNRRLTRWAYRIGLAPVSVLACVC